MRMYPAIVSGPGIVQTHKGLVWWDAGTLYVATGRPDAPAIDTAATTAPVQAANGWRLAGPAGDITVRPSGSCGCGHPWKNAPAAVTTRLQAGLVDA